MHVAFFCEYGQKDNIGTGHLYRSKEIARLLEQRGHKTSFLENGVLIAGPDVLVIDHMYSQADLIAKAKSAGMQVVLIDGASEDVNLVDASISAFANRKAFYRGVKYMAFPITRMWHRYLTSKKSNTVFVGMGGFDRNNHAQIVLEVLDKLNLNAIVAKSINHPNFKDTFSRVEMFEEENYYDAMHECLIGITNGGLTLFQSLYFGLPCIAVPQYEHQKTNIGYVSHCCEPCEPDPKLLEERIKWLVGNEYHRESLSRLAQNYVDGKGPARICKIIEDLE